MPYKIEELQAQCQHSITCYEDSYEEARTAHDYYHGRHWGVDEYTQLIEKRIPPMYINMFRKLSDRLVGHLGTVVNTVRIIPQQRQDVALAEILNTLVNYTFRSNSFDTEEGQDIQLQGLLTGLFCCTCMPVATGQQDEFGRDKYQIEMKMVPVYDIILDPASKELDYSDARYIHRSLWLTEEQLLEEFPNVDVGKLSIGVSSTGSSYDLHYRYNKTNTGNPCSTMYNVIHSCVQDVKGKRESIYWCGGEEIERTEITYNRNKFPYVIHKVHREDTANEFYGAFRDAIPHQQAINHAMISLHQIINTQKKFIGKNAVKDIDQFTKDLASPGVSAIPVEQLDQIIDAIKPGAAQEQLSIIRFHIEQLESQLGINDAFLGVANASDSGRKVEIQRQSTVTSLKTTERRTQQFTRNIARSVCNIIGQYFTFSDAYNIAEPGTVDRWVEINKPVLIIKRDDNGNPILDENNQPIWNYSFEEVRDPGSNKTMEDEDGNALYAPVVAYESEIRNFDSDIKVDTTIYNNEKEAAAELANTLLNSAAGQILKEVAPGAYLLAISELSRGLKTVATDKVADLMENIGNQMLSQSQPPPSGGQQQ